MKRESVFAFLKLLGAKVPVSQNRSGWVVSACPLQHWNHQGGESSVEVFGVKLGPGDSFSNCFACGWHGTQTDLIIEMKRLNKAIPQGKFKFSEALGMVMQSEDSMELEGLDTPDIEEILFGGAGSAGSVFPESWLSTFVSWNQVAFAREYLFVRGIGEQVADLLDLRADTRGNAGVFSCQGFQWSFAGITWAAC